MNIFIPQKNRQGVIGGGWTFNRNLIKGISQITKDIKFVDKIADCDIFLISGATMITKDEFEQAINLNKKIVLRVDNIPLPSRNRNGGFSHLVKYSKSAHKIIYQSNWALEYVGYWLSDDNCLDNDKNVIIYNGVDTDIFKIAGPKLNKGDKTIYLFDAHSSNENKRFDEARYWYNWELRINDNAEFWIIGECPEIIKLKEYNFDFVDPKSKVRLLGIIDDQQELAKVYRTADYLLFPAFGDACPNTVLEAKSCGCEIIRYNKEGGTKELLKENLDISIKRMAREYLEVFNNLFK